MIESAYGFCRYPAATNHTSTNGAISHMSVVMQDLAALVLVSGKVALPGLDIRRVPLGGKGGVVTVQLAGLPRRVVQNGIAISIRGVREGLAGVVDESTGELGSGLHAREDEAAVRAVVGREDLLDHLHLC